MYDKHLGKSLVCLMCDHNSAVRVLKVTVSLLTLFLVKPMCVSVGYIVYLHVLFGLL